MKKILVSGSVILVIAMLSFLIGCSRTPTVTVKANKRVVELVNSWGPDVNFYTAKKTPLTSIEGLRQEQIGCYGRELVPNVIAFYDAAGVEKTYGDAVQVIGPDNPVFSVARSPRLYLLSKQYASRLKDAAKVRFVE